MTGSYFRDFGVSIRLETRNGLPGPKDIIDMVNETRRAKRRVELPFQPEGRPQAVVLTARYDDHSGKINWNLYDGIEDSATVVWSALNPDPTKVVQAMRDWYTVARLAEGWEAKESRAAKTQETARPAQATPESSAQTNAATPQQPFPAMPVPPGYPPGFVTPPMSFPALPYAGGYVQYPGAPPYPPQWPGYPPYAPDPELLAQQWAQGVSSPQSLAGEASAGDGMLAGGLMLGDVLVAAGVIPTRTLQAALTLQNTSQITDRKQIGEILVSAGALPTNVLKAAVQLQNLARTGAITRSRMTELLVKVHASGTSLDTVMEQKSPVASRAMESAVSKRISASDAKLEREAEVTDEEQRKLKNVIALIKQLDLKGESGAATATKIVDLLKQAELVKTENLDANQKPADLVKSILIKELVHPTTFSAAVDCQKLIENEKLQVGQAVIALNYCDRGRVSLQEAIDEMGWDTDIGEL